METIIEVNEDSQEAKWVQQKLSEQITQDFSPANRIGLCLVAKDKSGKLLGGVRGFIHWEWLYIAQLWVEPHSQGQGLGKSLVHKSIQWAKTKNALGVYVDTFSEDARKFYLKNQFVEMGKIPNFPQNNTRYFFYKSI